MFKSAADVRVFLANELPRYTLDGDEDTVVFLVDVDDIERVSLKLWRNLPQPYDVGIEGKDGQE